MRDFPILKIISFSWSKTIEKIILKQTLFALTNQFFFAMIFFIVVTPLIIIYLDIYPV